ncbi:MAG: hypothetical protein HY436_01640 [Candidatus Liptonbacteria bacterium]|nr:hypothetical protein [Candidatus Liptonbacteria bacterium]
MEEEMSMFVRVLAFLTALVMTFGASAATAGTDYTDSMGAGIPCSAESGHGVIVLKKGDGITQALEAHGYSRDCLSEVMDAGGIQESALRILHPGTKLCVPTVCSKDPLPQEIVRRSRAIMRRDMEEARAVPVSAAALQEQVAIAALTRELAAANQERAAARTALTALRNETEDLTRELRGAHMRLEEQERALERAWQSRFGKVTALALFAGFLGAFAVWIYMRLTMRKELREVRREYDALRREYAGREAERARENRGLQTDIALAYRGTEQSFRLNRYGLDPSQGKEYVGFYFCSVPGCLTDDLQVNPATSDLKNLFRHLVKKHPELRAEREEAPALRLVSET